MKPAGNTPCGDPSCVDPKCERPDHRKASSVDARAAVVRGDLCEACGKRPATTIVGGGGAAEYSVCGPCAEAEASPKPGAAKISRRRKSTESPTLGQLVAAVEQLLSSPRTRGKLTVKGFDLTIEYAPSCLTCGGSDFVTAGTNGEKRCTSCGSVLT